MVDVGQHPAQRCTGCSHRVWLDAARELGACPRCGGPMGSLVAERRQAKRRGFATKREAQQALDRLRVAVADSEFVAPQNLTVGDYLAAWAEALPTSGLRASTVSSYRANLRLHVIPYVGHQRLQKLNPVELDRLYARLLADKDSGGAGLSPRSVRYVHTIVGRALADALRKGLVVRNVATTATPPSAKSTRAPEMATWSPAELRRFLDAIAGHELHALLFVAATTGMRRGELCGLRWTDVDLDAGTVTIVQQVVAVDGKAVIGEVKTDAGRRTIDIGEDTVAVLRSHRVDQARARLALGAGYTDRDLVFAGPTGDPRDPVAVSKAFGRLVEDVEGLPRIRLHDLRHTHAGHLVAAGQHALVISRRLGHSSVAFTLDRYGHLMRGVEAAAASAVEALLRNA